MCKSEHHGSFLFFFQCFLGDDGLQRYRQSQRPLVCSVCPVLLIMLCVSPAIALTCAFRAEPCRPTHKGRMGQTRCPHRQTAPTPTPTTPQCTPVSVNISHNRQQTIIFRVHISATQRTRAHLARARTWCFNVDPASACCRVHAALWCGGHRVVRHQAGTQDPGIRDDLCGGSLALLRNGEHSAVRSASLHVLCGIITDLQHANSKMPVRVVAGPLAHYLPLSSVYLSNRRMHRSHLRM